MEGMFMHLLTVTGFFCHLFLGDIAWLSTTATGLTLQRIFHRNWVFMRITFSWLLVLFSVAGLWLWHGHSLSFGCPLVLLIWGGGERTLILHMNTVFPCCYEYESEDGCFADAAMCRCRVPLSALLRLQVQGGSSTMTRIALQHLLIGAVWPTHWSLQHWCRVPLSALLRLQGGSSTMMRIALQHLLIGAVWPTHSSLH